MAKVLYLSYDGLSDNLGKSQILPYLVGLVETGHEITVVSFEKDINKAYRPDKKGLVHVPLAYHKSPPILSTIYDLFILKETAKKLHQTNDYDIVHCRSYITAMAGSWLKKKYNLKFVFDMRGFWADERIEGQLWPLKNPVFKMVYSFFKKKELQFFQESDATISLTYNAKDVIEQGAFRNIHLPLQHNSNHYSPSPITVIPCCADLGHFSTENPIVKKKNTLKEKLQIGTDEYVLLYLGSLGTWYMLDEMLGFYEVLKTKFPKTRFLILSGDIEVLKNKIGDNYHCEKQQFVFENENYSVIQWHGHGQHTITLTKALRKHVPAFISLCHASLFFILPSFSKKASSATKMGEIMAMGKPVITNTGWGDVDKILKDGLGGILVDRFSHEAYDKSIEKMKGFSGDINYEVCTIANTYFSLKEAVKRYDQVYGSLVS